jgi:hypothetical protein
VNGRGGATGTGVAVEAPMDMAEADRRRHTDGDQTAPHEALPAKLRRLDFYRAEVRHEFNLLSSRLNAYITSQSFLVIAFALSMSNMNPRWPSPLRVMLPTALAILGFSDDAGNRVWRVQATP